VADGKKRGSSRAPARRPPKGAGTAPAAATARAARPEDAPAAVLPGGPKLWSQLFEHSPDIVVVVDRERRIAFANRPLLDRRPAALVGTDLCAHLPPDQCEATAVVLERVFRTGAPTRHELAVPDPGSRRMVLEIRVAPIRHGDRVAFALLTAVDVTEQRRAAQIQEATRRISEAAHTAPTLQALFAAIHGIVGELMPARNFYIALHDAAAGLLSFPYLVDEFDVAPAPKKPGRGLTEYVLRSGEPLLVTPDVMRELVRRGEVELIGSDSVDWLGVPLTTDGRTIGVLVVQTYTEGVRYSETDKQILRFVSTQVAMAVERKRAEAALRASEEQYRRLVEVAPDLIAVHCEGRIVFMNAAGARLLGAGSPDELVGRPVLDFVHPDSRLTVQRRIGAMLAHDERVPPIDELFLRLDGTPVPVEVSATALVYGDRPAVQVVVRDVTERLRAEAALRESEERFRSFVESTTDWVWSVDRAGALTYANPAVTAVLGYAPDELRGRSAFALVHPDDLAGATERFDRSASEREPWRNLVVRWRRRDGTYAFLETSAVPVVGADGGFDGCRGVSRDITERVVAEEALRTSEARLARAQAIAHLGIWELDLTNLEEVHGNALWWSDETYRLFGYAPGSVRVTSDLFFGSLGPEDGARVRAAVEHAVRTGGPYVLEHRITRPDGTERVAREEASIVRDEAGRPVRLVGTVLDVTEQRHLEEQLRQAQKMEAVGQLAGGIAHDFNNLLTTVLAANELLGAGLPPEGPHREDVETIRQAAGRAAELTRNLLAFSRQQTLELRAVAPEALLTDFVRLARRVVPEDVEVALRVDAPKAVIRADPVAIEQMLMNLVTNARDAMPLGGKLTFAVGLDALDDEFVHAHGWGRAGEYVTLSVTDTGAGMDAETRRHAFEPFFTTKPVGEGTGLGLAMVYGLVKQHGGFVDVASEPGRGTTFRLYFPAVAESCSPRDAAETPDLRGGSETVLLVEDDASLRRTATRVLTKYGYTVLTANDGAEALVRLRSGRTRPALVISDVVMPNASGPQLLAALRDGGGAPRMLFTSGYTSRDVHERGLIGPDVPFLAKPWTIADLLRKVREVLDQPAAP